MPAAKAANDTCQNPAELQWFSLISTVVNLPVTE
jgi:hypothetical protein